MLSRLVDNVTLLIIKNHELYDPNYIIYITQHLAVLIPIIWLLRIRIYKFVDETLPSITLHPSQV